MKYNYLFALMAIFLFESCSKKSDSEDPKAFNQCQFPSYQIEALTYSRHDTTKYTYDDKGRISIVDQGGLEVTHFTYEKNRIVMTATDVFGEDDSNIFYLNDKGLISREQRYRTNYGYDDNGYMIKLINTGFQIDYELKDTTWSTPMVYILEYDKGNLVKYYDESYPSYVTTYTYSTKQNTSHIPFYGVTVPNFPRAEMLAVQGWFGKLSVNELSSYTENGIKYQFFKDAQYDNLGRLISVGDYKYGYNCQ